MHSNILQDFFNNWGQYVVVQAYAGGSMEVQLSNTRDEESDGASSLIAARVKISAMMHTVEASQDGPQVSYGIGGKRGKESLGSDKFFAGSSTINWTGGDTDFQVPSLDNINADLLHQWEQSLSIKPGVLTTDLTLVPIYEIVDDEDKRLTLRDALDDLLTGGLKVSRQGRDAHSRSRNNRIIESSIQEITSKVESDIVERMSVKTRRAAVEMAKPTFKCCIL